MDKGARLQLCQGHAGDEDEAREARVAATRSGRAKCALLEVERQAPLHPKLDMLQSAQHDRRAIATEERAIRVAAIPAEEPRYDLRRRVFVAMQGDDVARGAGRGPCTQPNDRLGGPLATATGFAGDNDGDRRPRERLDALKERPHRVGGSNEARLLAPAEKVALARSVFVERTRRVLESEGLIGDGVLEREPIDSRAADVSVGVGHRQNLLQVLRRLDRPAFQHQQGVRVRRVYESSDLGANRGRFNQAVSGLDALDAAGVPAVIEAYDLCAF